MIRQPSAHWLKRPQFAALAAFGIGVGLACLAALAQVHTNARDAAGRFDALALRTADQVRARLQIYEYGLRGARGALLSAGPGISRERFRLYSESRDIDHEFPGARGMGVIRRVAPADESAFVSAARLDGNPDFAIHQLELHAGERYVIQYIEPAARNLQALGLDIASDGNRRSAAERAMRTGAATLTGPTTLLQAAGKPQRSFLLLLPIYRPYADSATTAQRESATVAWAYAPLVMDEVLADFAFGSQFSLALRDLAPADGGVFFTTTGHELPATLGLTRRIAIPIHGRTWQAEVRATPAFVTALNLRSPGAPLALGVAIAALLALLMYIYAQSAQRALQVRAEKARRSAIVESSSDAIIGETLDGLITDWNHGAERLLGYPSASAIGRPAATLLLPRDRFSEDAALRAAMERGDSLPAFDATRKHADGTLIEVSITVSPILSADGRRIGLSKTIRDVRKAKQAERRVNELNASLERQVAERTELLEAARRDLQNILDAVPSLISYWDRALRNRFANHAYRTWFGLDPATLPGQHVREFLGQRFDVNLPRMEAALRGEPQVFEVTLPMPEGIGSRHAMAHYLPDRVNGEVRGFYVIVFDITQQKQDSARLAAALRENDALLRTIHGHAIVSVTDPAGRIMDVNDRFCAISGYSREALLGQDHRIVGSGVHDKGFWIDMWRTIAGGQPWRGEICNRAKDGALYWVDSMIAPFSSEDGKIEKYISIRTDITVAKRTEQSLRASQAFLDRAGKVAGVGAWLVEIASQRLTWSAQMYCIHEVEASYEPKLHGGLQFYPPEVRPILERAVMDAISAGTSWDLELPLVTARGRAHWVRSVGEVESENGKPVRLVGTMQDITARKQVEISLAHERHLMASLLDNLPDPIHFKDCEGRFLRVNPGLAQRYGLANPADALGKTDADFLTEERARRTQAIEQQIMVSGEPAVEREERENWPDRPPTWSLTTKMPLRDAQGRVIGTFGISRDITARKRIEGELQEANERFALATDGAGIGVWEFEVASNTFTWDERMYRLYGHSITDKEQPYALWSNSLHPDDRERSEQELSAALRGEREFDTEFRVTRPDGEVRYLKASARVVRDASGAPVRMTGVNFDITERKRAELELLETSSLLQSVLESASEISLIATDPNLIIKVFNSGAERLLGYTSEEVVHRATPVLIHDVEEVRARAAELSVLSGQPVEGGAAFIHPLALRRPREWTYVRKDQSRVTVSLVVTAMHGNKGELFGYLGMAHDVTRQKQYEESLREAMHRAEQASETKSQFLANMSHEIRTPMNAVIGLSYLLGKTALDSEQAAFLSKIRLASKSLLALINDILDLSKIEAGEVLLERVPFSPRGLIEELREVMAVQADAKGITFEVEIAADLPQAIEGDASRLNQILTNLLSNAIKFTDRGGVQLRVRQETATQTGTVLRFEVEDSGIGIAPEVQPRLFAPFAQADASTTRRFGGTGLGLSIVKRLAHMMGGEVGIVSTPGVGSKFWVSLEFGLVAGEAPPRSERHSIASSKCALLGVRVLVVDDSDINLDVAKGILELEGAQVSLANNGQEAFDRLQSKPDAFDVVLMDVQMPVLDGHEATRRIRGELGLRDLPIIALTADARASERQRTEAAGMNDFISKPFEAQTLIRGIRRFVAIPERRPATEVESMVPGVPAWPEIEGIDSNDARRRLGGDPELFQSLLALFLSEFSDIAIPLLADPIALTSHTARMHKLRGGAGQLGAKAIHELAFDTEAACRNGEAKQAAELTKQLGVLLQRLRASAELHFVTTWVEPESTRLHSAEPDPRVLIDLLDLLRQQSLSVLEHFRTISPQIRRLVGQERYERVRDQIQNLQFSDAARVLEQEPFFFPVPTEDR